MAWTEADTIKKLMDENDELAMALNSVIPRCKICFDYATLLNPENLWPLCNNHQLAGGGALKVIPYHVAIKAHEVFKRLV